jgi:endonuclease/exonuclease/phosphatase family metal-dependent hydrolase
MPARTSSAWWQPLLLTIALLAAASCTATPPPAATANAAIAVGTFNIRYANPKDGDNAWPHRRDLVMDILREGDIWGLQEALPEQIEALRQALPEFNIVTRSRERNPTEGEACPVLFRHARWALDPIDGGTFWLSDKPDEVASRAWDAALPRIVTFVRLIEKATGRALYVYNAHFDHRGKQARLESARLLAQRIASRQHADPVIVLGDFNTGPQTAPLEALLQPSTGLRDAWLIRNPDQPDRGTFNGWKEALGTTRIDYVLVNQQLAIDACWIDTRKPFNHWPSDHAPVRASLSFRNGDDLQQEALPHGQ